MHRFHWFGLWTPFFMLHDVVHAMIIRGYIPNRNCKGLILKDIHRRETLLNRLFLTSNKENKHSLHVGAL